MVLLMLPTMLSLRGQLHIVISDKEAQGHVAAGLRDELDGLLDSYDTLLSLAARPADLPLRSDWPCVEPNELEAIWAECDDDRPLAPVAPIDLDDCAGRVEAAFLGCVCGCILREPLEIDPN